MMRVTAVAAVAALSCLPHAVAKPVSRQEYNQTNVWDFALLKPTVDLQWTPCFEDFTCTILEVPLDYSDEDAGTTGIAFIKWTSPNATTSAEDILINPGGPGGSGVQFVRSGLSLLQQQFGTSNSIVGFDPRGVNNSGPDLSCFPGHKDTAKLYDPDFGQAVDVNSSLSLLNTWAQAGAFGQWCSDVHGPESPSKYANTIATATDMLHYIELTAEANKEQKEDAKLYYYGASYGTVLGSTFATLFPDRVGRMILDGVVDGEDYYQGRWAANLFDADAAVESFFQYCFEGGASVCAFWDESPAAIQARFEAVFADIAANPIIVNDRSAVKTPTIITISDLKTAITIVPYSPVVFFPVLAEIMSELEQRNGSTFATAFITAATLNECAPDNVSNAQQVEPRYYIACNDADGRTNYSTVESWTEYANHLAEQSKYLGESWAASTSLECRSLQVYPPESQVLSGTPSASNTSNPILFIGNTLDPVTPLRGAKKMSGLFGGSRVLTQNSVGHCSSAALSSCTMEYMQKYIATGSLPEEGTICESEQVPFKDEVTESQDATVSMRKRHYVQR